MLTDEVSQIHEVSTSSTAPHSVQLLYWRTFSPVIIKWGRTQSSVRAGKGAHMLNHTNIAKQIPINNFLRKKVNRASKEKIIFFWKTYWDWFIRERAHVDQISLFNSNKFPSWTDIKTESMVIDQSGVCVLRSKRGTVTTKAVYDLFLVRCPVYAYTVHSGADVLTHVTSYNNLYFYSTFLYWVQNVKVLYI